MKTRLRMIATLACVLLVAPTLFAAQGIISGIVVDSRNGMPVIGADVIVQGTEKATRTDMNGLFLIDVTPGSYQVEVRHSGYQGELIGGVEVGAGGDQNLGIVLNPTEKTRAVVEQVVAEGEMVGAVTPEEVTSSGDPESSGSVSSSVTAPEPQQSYTEVVTVTAEAADATEQAILVERKNADEISDAIGRQEISKTADSTSAGVMRRVTGVTLQDNKFVYVRGLGERYSQTTMNGTAIPTTEPEKRVVPLDLFSANLLQKIKIAYRRFTRQQHGRSASRSAYCGISAASHSGISASSPSTGGDR